MQQFKDYTTICSSAPSEFLSILALNHHEELVARNLALVMGNRSVLDGMFDRWNEVFEWVCPQAGSIGFPKLLADGHAGEFCGSLVEKCGVLLLPGGVYDYDDRHFRIGFGRKNMGECLARLEQCLEDVLR